MRNEKILVIDDETAIRRLIWKALQATGILIYQSDSITSTMDIMTRVKFDLFLLDVSLEHENDGYYLAQMIREKSPTTPIIFLSAKKEEEDIIAGLETGADLYLTKPFSPDVLRAQVLATLKRSKVIQTQQDPANQKEMIAGDFRFDRSRYQLFKNDELIPLSSKQTQLMQFFIENPDQVFSKEQIYSNVWNSGDVDPNTIMVFISQLRNKIEDDPKHAKYLRTVWGIGYTFIPTGD
ncbi:response regulator transcription factor [Vagococcus acidifermentans]|uniref:DNA-binding response regulator n=1 Tax=Vagococcus acidifermentans TaxID=564710 RepID=A0A430B306_9ENTE|nr:response regulator transcription factor [Vagococcus acidifermentans]RSU14725.1 DNA-binding response regulator [Vagococcus acidifermentans]